MAKTKISEYDSTAANNTDIDGINIAEGCAPSGINNAIREQMAHLKDGLGAGTPVFLDQTNNRVGIGTTSPDRSLHIAGNPAQIIIEDTGGGTDDKRAALFTDSGVFEIASKNDDDSTRVNDIFCADLGTGNIGIGTNSPAAKFELEDGGTSEAVLMKITADDSSPYSLIIGNDTYSTSDTDGLAMHVGNSGEGIINMRGTSSSLQFRTVGSERARIDSSGNLLVAKTATGSDAGAELRSTGYVSFTRDNATVFTVRRNGTESSHMNFLHETGEIGAIGTSGSALRMFSTATNYKGLAFEFKAITPTSNQGVDQDNSTDLGSATTRFDDVRATNGTIQTSDENDKQDIASLTSAEITAATAISKLFKTYKWKDKVADKGDSARTHTGVVAQQVQTAMADAGLDASKYAFWCSDTWWEKDVEVAAVEANEEEGREAADAYTRTDTYSTKDAAPEGATERTRLGVRYPELLSFIGAATEQRLTSIEARLDALEG